MSGVLEGGMIACTYCHKPMLAGEKYLAAFERDGKLEINVACQHITLPDLEDAVAILGSTACALFWLRDWITRGSLRRCEHEMAEEEK